MKHLLLLFTIFLSATSMFAQQRSGNLTVYSNTGKKFYVVLNGVRQNTEPQTNVNVSGLTDSWYKCLIVAEDKSFSIEKNVGVKKDSVTTYQIAGKKGKYKMRFYSEASLNSYTAPQGQTDVVYHPTEYIPTTETVGGNSGSGNMNGGVVTNNGGMTTTTSGGGSTTGGSSTTITTTTTTTSSSSGVGQTTSGTTMGGETVNMGITITENGSISTSTQAGSESVNININVNEMGLGTNINMSGTGNGTTYEESTTVTSTTTSTTTVNGVTTTSGAGSTTFTTTVSGDGTHYETTEQTIVDGNPNQSVYYESCMTASTDIALIKTAIEKESFSEDKMRIALSSTSNRCLTVDQVREIALLFTFSEDRMKFVQSAYGYCLNRENYMLLSDLFTFSEDKATLENYIKTH
jgi:hypothetical protein